MHRLPRVITPFVGTKAKVLLVDDHRGMLDRVSAMLSGEFDIAGVATDGRRAVVAANQVAPDVIVLDLNMPGIDGFQTKHALDQAGSRSPVVFVSAADDDDVTVEAFRRGGRAYVVKS